MFAYCAGSKAQSVGRRDRQTLLRLERKALRYFIDNQREHGLILDRQRNRGRRDFSGLCSTASTGMGLIALALAAEPHHKLISRDEAIKRVRLALQGSFRLPHEHGMMPHFVDADTFAVIGTDSVSTIDSSWLIAGALWAAERLNDDGLKKLARRLYRRVDWSYWRRGHAHLINHGSGADGKPLPAGWDRFNSETLFMYVLGIGASNRSALPASSWTALGEFYGTVESERFMSADLGLFIFQYSTELMAVQTYPTPNGINYLEMTRTAACANKAASDRASERYRTFKHLWGLSAGDGPGDSDGAADAYRCYSPLEMDGTAHITASVASVGVVPNLVLASLRNARKLAPNAEGRYGYSNVNLDKDWVSRDVVGIDLGALVMACENFLFEDGVRSTFENLPVVRTAKSRLARLVDQH